MLGVDVTMETGRQDRCRKEEMKEERKVATRGRHCYLTLVVAVCNGPVAESQPWKAVMKLVPPHAPPSWQLATIRLNVAVQWSKFPVQCNEAMLR